MAEVGHFLSIWWWYLLYAVLTGLVTQAVVGFYHRLENWLDRRHADDLPQYTGEWVRSRIDGYGLSDRLRVTTWPEGIVSSGDCYLPDANLIVLTPRTFFKNDPTFWAAGAHELGHALIRERATLLAGLLRAARKIHELVTGLARSFLLVNVLYGYAVLGQVGLWLMWAGVALAVAALVDEAVASTIAMRMLREDAHLDRRGWMGALVGLLGAFSTYLASLVAHIVVITQYDRIIQLAEARADFTAAGELAGWPHLVAAVLAGVLLLSALPLLVQLVSDQPISDKASLWWLGLTVIPLTVFMYLVWDQPLGTGFAVCVALAARPVLGVAVGLVLLPLFLFFDPLARLYQIARWVNRLLGGYARTERPRGEAGRAAAKRAKAQMEDELFLGKRLLDEVTAAGGRTSVFELRLTALGRLLFVPLVVYWIFA